MVMGDLRENILRQELQREIEEAKRLERDGNRKEASEHYLRASEIYRRIAYNAPPERAQEMFGVASKYETFGKALVKGTPEPEMQEEIISTLIVSQKPEVSWDDIGGLDEAKKDIREAIILPFVKAKPPYIKAPRTILLYGPPGSGKTLLAKASSNTLSATFFEARMPTLLSKYFGESQKLINTLFEKAKKTQPSLIFIDELDSVAMSRDSNIDESTRRVLAQLLTEIEGFNTSKDERVLIMGATNKPWDLDDAVVSRFQKRIYVPLPDDRARRAILQIHLEGADISEINMSSLVERTGGFSGRDLASLCRQVITNMVREQNPSIERLTVKELEAYSLKYRSLQVKDFDSAFEKIKPTTQPKDIEKYEEWRKEFGG
jgi:katanin p60 ATPase-containing subunit A1